MSEPPITISAAHHSGANGRITRIVIHATCPDVGYPAASKNGAAHGTAKYFAMTSSGGSAHYVEGVDREEHCVPDNVVAWHAPPNTGSIGLEITADGGDAEAFHPPSHAYTRTQWLSPQVWPALVRSAARARELCDRHDVPKMLIDAADLRAGKHGICPHSAVSKAWGQSGHSDPGPNFPWPEFMQEVTRPGSTPTLGGLSMSDVQTILDAIAANAEVESGRYQVYSGRYQRSEAIYQDLAERTDRNQAAIKALAGALSPTVQAAVEAALADRVDVTGVLTVTPKDDTAT